jgi:hypothetical protein
LKSANGNSKAIARGGVLSTLRRAWEFGPLRGCHRRWPRTAVVAAALFLAAAFRCAEAGESQDWELRVFTHDTQKEIAEDAIGLRLTGAIPRSLAKQLRDTLLSEPGKYNHVVVEFNSEGGDLEAVKEASAVLREVARTKELTTRVLGGGICASGCVALFMQGQKRKASGASVWIFHGACKSGTNVPSLSATIEYLDLLVESGVNPDFTCKLVQQGYVTAPGNYFLSGFELFHHHNSNVITELLPAWQPEQPFGHIPFVPR